VFDIGGTDLVDADLVVGRLEGLVAVDEASGLADEPDTHRPALVIDHVVVAAENVLREFDVAGETAVGERFVDVGDGCLFGVELVAYVEVPLLQHRQQRECRRRRLASGHGGDLEVLDAPAPEADSDTVRHVEFGVARPHDARELLLREFLQTAVAASNRPLRPVIDAVDDACTHCLYNRHWPQIVCGPRPALPPRNWVPVLAQPCPLPVSMSVSSGPAVDGLLA